MYLTRILLFEDNQADADLIRNYIQNSEQFLFGFKHVNNLKDGIEYLNQNLNQVDLILLDLNLEDSDYMQTMQEIIPRFNFLPIIVFTSMGEKIGNKAIEMGAEDYISKSSLTTEGFQKTILFTIKRFQHNKVLTLFDELDQYTNTMRKAKFIDLVEKSKTLSEDKAPSILKYTFSGTDISISMRNNFVRGINMYLEKHLSLTLLGVYYDSDSFSVYLMVYLGEKLMPKEVDRVVSRYIKSSNIFVEYHESQIVKDVF